MALAAEDRKQVWSAQTTIELREKSMAYTMFDTSWSDEWENGASKVTIPKPNFAATGKQGVSAEDRTRGGDWPTAREGDSAVVVMSRQGSKAASNKIDWEENIEIPWPIVERYRNRQAFEIASEIDRAIFDAAIAAPSTTISAGTEDTHEVPKTFPYTAVIPSGRDHPLMEAIDDFALRMVRVNAIDGAGSPTGSASSPFMIVQPELVRSLRAWLRSLGLNFDPLTAELLRGNPGLAGQGYVGNLSGVSLFQWNHLRVPDGTEWLCYAGVREAFAVGVRPVLVQYFDPANNQVEDNPSYLFRQTAEYAYVETMDELHYKINIEAG